MAKLKKDAKVLIVQRLATFVTPTEIVAELKELGVVATIQQVVYYDPSTKGTDLAPEWRTLHADTRAKFTKESAGIAITHKSFRLQELLRLYRKAVGATRPNIVLAKELLEQAAKEMGEAYTNRRIVTAGDPITELAKVLGITPEELVAALAAGGADT